MAQAVLCQFESAYHHILFVNRRNLILASESVISAENAIVLGRDRDVLREELRSIVRLEMETVQTMIELRHQDSRIGYESSSHYFYTLQDLKEKMINLVYCDQTI